MTATHLQAIERGEHPLDCSGKNNNDVISMVYVHRKTSSNYKNNNDVIGMI